jgi:hypothetical protein
VATPSAGTYQLGLCARGDSFGTGFWLTSGSQTSVLLL